MVRPAHARPDAARHHGAGLASFLLALVTAGCLAGPGALQAANSGGALPSIRSLLELEQVIDFHAPTTDSLLLHGTVYLPKVPNGTTLPTIMDMGPYYGDLGSDTNVYSAAHPPNLLYEHFLRRGYAVALVSVRGTGQSEGCFMVGGKQEQRDTASAIDWVAKQPWSNGKVAMIGISYDGSTPYEGLASGDPHLAAIVPGEGITDMYRYTFFDGVPVEDGPSFNTYYVADVDWTYTNPNGIAPWAMAQPTNVCPGQASVLVSPYQSFVDGSHSAFYQERDTTTAFPKSKTASLIVEGFDDWNVRMDNIQWDWGKLAEPKRLILGQWEHNVPWRNSWNRDWSMTTYNDTVQQWLDAFLLNDSTSKAAALAAPPVIAQDSTGRWWNLSTWPPAESVDTPLYLNPNDTLTETPAPTTGHVQFATDPSAPTKTQAAVNPVCEDAGPTFCTPLPSGYEVDFKGRTLEAPLFLMGNPALHLSSVSVNEPGGYLEGVLYDVAPDGSRERVDPGYLNLAERGGLNTSESVPTNTPMNLTVRFYGLAHVFPAGHRIELALMGNDPDVGGKYEDTGGTPLNPWSTTFTITVGHGSIALFDAPVYPMDPPRSS
ncbi:MAG: CocE/NonD family hydrolase [Thermoplasmatota archaeon]